MIQYCTNNGAVAPLADASHRCMTASDERPLALSIAERRGRAEQMVAKLRERLERSLKQWRTSLDTATPTSAEPANPSDKIVMHRNQVHDAADNIPPTVIHQSVEAAVIQISGTLQQRKLESNGHSSRFIVSPTPKAMPATTVANRRDGATEPLSVIVPMAWTTCGHHHRRVGELPPSLKISTGPTSPISTLTTTGLVHNHQHSGGTTNVANVTTGISVCSSSSSPTSSVDSGVSSPAAYGSGVIVGDELHFYHHQHYHHVYHNHHPIVVAPLSPSGVHVRHHHRSGCQQALAAADARYFQFGQLASVVSYTAGCMGPTRRRSASLSCDSSVSSRLLPYSPLCAACDSNGGVRLLLEDNGLGGLRLTDEAGESACRRSTLLPLYESPRDDNAMDAASEEQVADCKEDNDDDESENGKTLMAADVDRQHASILPTADDDVFTLRRAETTTATLEHSAGGKSSQNTAENFERNGLSAFRCSCTRPTPLSSVTLSQLLSCSAPTTTGFSSSFEERRPDTGLCCTTTISSVGATVIARGHSTSSVSTAAGLKGILKKPPPIGMPCGCAAAGGGLRGQASVSRGRFRLSRSVSECADESICRVAGGLSYAFNAMELSGRNLSASSDVELMEMDEAEDEEDESSRSSWENGGVSPPALAYAGDFDAFRSMLDGSDSSSMNAESADEKIAAELAPRKKRVSFSEHVQARIYRSSASIFGQRKKNDKRNRTKRRRSESEGDASHDDEEYENDDRQPITDAQPVGEAVVGVLADRREDGGGDACGLTKPKTGGLPASVCDSCRNPIKAEAMTTESERNKLAARRDSGIDDGDCDGFDNNNKPLVVAATKTAVVVRGLSTWSRVVFEACNAEDEDAMTAKRIRRLVSTNSALGDEDVPLTAAPAAN